MNVYSIFLISLFITASSLASAVDKPNDTPIEAKQKSFMGMATFVGGEARESRITLYHFPTSKPSIKWGVYYGSQDGLEVSVSKEPSELTRGQVLSSTIERVGASLVMEYPVAESVFVSSGVNLGTAQSKEVIEEVLFAASIELEMKVSLSAPSRDTQISFGTLLRFDIPPFEEDHSGFTFGHSAVLPITSIGVTF